MTLTYGCVVVFGQNGTTRSNPRGAGELFFRVFPERVFGTVAVPLFCCSAMKAESPAPVHPNNELHPADKKATAHPKPRTHLPTRPQKPPRLCP